MANRVRISLANKCQLLFGAAVVLILGAALTVLAVRMQTLVREGQEATARQLAAAWLAAPPQLRTPPTSHAQGPNDAPATNDLSVRPIPKQQFEATGRRDPFLAEAIAHFQVRPDRHELFRPAQNPREPDTYRYARAIRLSDTQAVAPHDGVSVPPASVSRPVNPLEMVLLIQLPAGPARRQLMLNRVYIIAAGLLAGLLAIGAFWFITTRIILSPIRVLRDTAAKVSAGDLNIRSDINTGDEFEQMSDMFNTMLENLKRNEDQLRSINKSLDLKLGELAQHNVSLHEANLIKGKFLANVSHELRTPLNSIIGFAEVLGESVQEGSDPAYEKRRRYITNIITSSRQLLDLINDLLDLAKIEAGRMELRVQPVSIADTAEGLVNLIRPQAEKQGIHLRLVVEPGIPVVHTDAGKFQQIVFNFLSNAIKFTPRDGTVTLSAKRVTTVPGQGVRSETNKQSWLCVSVIDTGPGIPLEKQDQIFEKFTQLDSTVTREHGGTGLGLAISRELAGLLQGRVELTSDTGKGATFSLIIPMAPGSKRVPLMPDTDEQMPPKHDPAKP